MTDKRFYQNAADEVASGILDKSLWIKVCAEMPDADRVVQQSKYIQLRANELAIANAKNKAISIGRAVPPMAGKIVRSLIKLLIVTVIVSVFIVYPVIFFLHIYMDQSDIRANQSRYINFDATIASGTPSDKDYDALVTIQGSCEDMKIFISRPAGSFLFSLIGDPSLYEFCKKVN